MELIVNRRTIKDLVDLGASHNLLQKEFSDELRIRAHCCDASIKGVNSKAKEVVGVASIVNVKIR